MGNMKMGPDNCYLVPRYIYKITECMCSKMKNEEVIEPSCLKSVKSGCKYYYICHAINSVAFLGVQIYMQKRKAAAKVQPKPV